MSFRKTATEVAMKEINYKVRSIQNGKSVKLNKEKQKLKIGKFIAHYFYKILIYIIIYFFNLHMTEFSFGKKALFHKWYVIETTYIFCDWLSVITSIAFYIIQRYFNNLFSTSLL